MLAYVGQRVANLANVDSNALVQRDCEIKQALTRGEKNPGKKQQLTNDSVINC